MPIDTANLPSSSTWTGVLIAVVVIMAGVVTYLFKLYITSQKEKDAELKSCRDGAATDRAKCASDCASIRAEYEEKHVEIVEQYSESIRKDREEARVREEVLRKDYGDRLDRIAVETQKATSTQLDVLNKMFDRFVTPRRPERAER